MTTESVAPETAKTASPDIAGTVRRLRETFASGRTRSVEWRKQQLHALEKMMVDNEAAIADALEQDLGRKPFEAWLADIASTAGEAHDAAKNVGKWTRRKLPAAGVVAAARPRLGRVRAVRHGADHRCVELPVRV